MPAKKNADENGDDKVVETGNPLPPESDLADGDGDMGGDDQDTSSFADIFGDDSDDGDTPISELSGPEAAAKLAADNVVQSAGAPARLNNERNARRKYNAQQEKIEEAQRLADDVKAAHEEAMKVTAGNMSPDEYKAHKRALSDAEAAANTKSTTRPGGVYKVNGIWVDANGNKVAPPDEA